MGIDGFGGDNHALDHRMRVRFQNAAVHERAGIALVGIAEYVFDLPRAFTGELPFQAGRKAGAAAAAQTRLLHLVDDLYIRHLQQGARGAQVAVAGDVVVDRLRVDQALVAQGARHLEGEKGDFGLAGDDLFGGRVLVKQFFDRLAADQVLLDNRGNVVDLDFLVKNIARMHHHDRPHGAKTVAAGFDHFDLVLQVFGRQFPGQGLLDLQTAGGMAPGSAADQQIGFVLEVDAVGLPRADRAEILHREFRHGLHS